MKDEALSYVYLCGRLGVLRRNLTAWDTLVRMAETGNCAEAERLFFAQRGAQREKEGAEDLLERETARIYEDLRAVAVGSAVLDIFRFPWDCHNAKVLLRQRLAHAPREDILSRCGAVTAERIGQAVEEKEGGVSLPRWLREGIAEAKRVWAAARNPALVDLALDRTCFAACTAKAEESGSPRAQAFMCLSIDGINLQTLLRMPSAAEAAVEEWLLPGGSVSAARLLECRRSGKLEDAFSAPQLRRAARRGTAFGAEQALCRGLQEICDQCLQVAWGPDALLGFLLQLRLRQDAVRFVLAQLRRDGARAKEYLEEWYG